MPATEEAATLLHVAVPGRFTLAAHSAAGASLRLVDMLAGPGDEAGIAGTQDGRVDALLECGTYKLRVASAPRAQGAVSLSVTPFRDAAPLARVPPGGGLVAAALADGEQRRFWLVVPADGRVRVSAAGRALADLRLWRDGRDLDPLMPQARDTEPVRGHPMTALLLDGRVEPGTYLVAAYGGLVAPWADGSAALPFFLRVGALPTLAQDWAGGAVGPSGEEVFSVPRWAAALRLDLPRSAAASLQLGDGPMVEIAARAREPWAVLRLPDKREAPVVLRADAGQPYRLRVIGRTGAAHFAKTGEWWVSADTLGIGGDEVPPDLLLLRHEPEAPTRIVADTVPHVGPGAAWRARFNLRGPTRLIVQADRGGELALRTEGVALDRDVDPQSTVDVAADMLGLSLVPARGASGALDVTFGPPGLQAGLSVPYPADPVVPFGVQSLWPGQSLELDGPRAPGVEMGLSARPSPVDLDDAPLAVTQMPGQALSVKVKLSSGATLRAGVIGAPGAFAPAAVAQADDVSTVALPAPAAPRTVVLWGQPPAPSDPAPDPRAAASLPRLAPGRPVFFDLAADAARSFALHVDQGGLYRVETLGRLRTEAVLGTSFIAEVASGAADGAGQNMLLQPWLRAGDYRVTVTARDSAGHLGLLAAPAVLREGATLRAGTRVRATLAAGEGLEVPIEVAVAGRYGVSLLGQAGGFSARLDDAQGWPLLAPGPFDGRELALRPGRYRLMVTPGPTQQRLVASLEAVTPPRTIAGHGPHALAAGEMLAATWREPPPGVAERVPDAYVFTLAGRAHAHLRLGRGMTGALVPASGAPIHVGESWDGVLAAGAWRLEARAQGRDDRLDYTVSLRTDELQPDQPREIGLPSSLAFDIAAERVVALTSAGAAPVRAVLRDAHGSVLARAGARADDWNTALSQRLPAGRYTLDLSSGAPPGAAPVHEARRVVPEPDGEDAAQDGEAEQPQGGAPDMPADTPDVPSAQDGDAGRPATSVTLRLPPDLPAAPAPSRDTALAGAGVHVLTVPPPPRGALLVATAHGVGTTVLALERRADDGAWRQVAQASGAAPLAAALADGDARPWRVTLWGLDGGAAPLAAALRAVTDAPAGRAEMLGGMGVAVARVVLATPEAVAVAGPPGLLQASWPGHGATPLDAGQALPQGGVLWLLGPQAGPVAASPLAAGPLILTVPAGAQARLPAGIAPAGRLRVWRAESGEGQPAWVDGGAVSALSAVRRGPAAPVLEDAGAGSDAMRAQVSATDVAMLPDAVLGAPRTVRLGPGQGVRLGTPAAGDLSLALTPGVAAFVDGAGGEHGVWSPGEPVSRIVPGGASLTLANLGAGQGFAGVAAVPHVGPDLLAAGQRLAGFHGAAGSFDIDADVTPGGHLGVAGAATLLVRDAAGRVWTGTEADPAPGRARVTVTHLVGATVLWLAAPGRSPWPAPVARDVALPGTLALGGPAMALRLPSGGPMLLHAVTTAPVLLGVGEAAPELFPAGAAFHRAVDGGAVLRILAAQDGAMSGTLALWSEPLRPAPEGLGQTVVVPPGGGAAFAFTLTRPGRVGVGVRAEPDTAAVSLLDGAGRTLGEGVAQLRDLPAGRYVIEARVPPGAPATTLRPALLGTVPRPDGPPADVAEGYLELVGLRPALGR